MKKFVSWLLIITLSFSLALAEEEEITASFFESFGEWVSQTAGEASDWIVKAWEIVSAWLKGAWGDAAKWVEESWNSSSEWVNEIWGDVSAWAIEKYDATSGTVKAWWTRTFDTVTEPAANEWEWLVEEADSLKEEFQENLGNVREAVSSTGDNAEESVRNVFNEMLGRLNLNEENSGKVWETIRAYAEEKGIDGLSAGKLALPYLFQLTVDSDEAGEDAPAIIIAQYLTAVIDKLGIESGEAADAVVSRLTDALEAK